MANINTTYSGWLNDDSVNSKHKFSATVGQFLSAKSPLYNLFISNFVEAQNENTYVTQIDIKTPVNVAQNDANGNNAAFNIYGPNNFATTASATAIYLMNTALRIGAKVSKPALASGGIDISDKVNGLMDNQAIAFTQSIVAQMFSTHKLSLAGNPVGQDIPNATIIPKIDLSQPVYEQILQQLTNMKKDGAYTPNLRIVISADIEQALLLDSRYASANASITASQVFDGFAHTINGVEVIVDPTLDTPFSYEGKTYDINCFLINLDRNQIKIPKLEWTPLQIVNGDSEEYELAKIKACDIYTLAVIDPKAIRVCGTQS